jgi:hypothetical protein
MGTMVLALFSPSFATTIFGGHAGGVVCDLMGGRWGSAQNVCVTRACYAAGDCGFWLHPNTWCRDLRKGDPIGEVYFRLGNPGKVEGNTYTWFHGKADPVEFTAIIENGVLKSVNCL